MSDTLVIRAKKLRREMTDAERRLWAKLRNRQQGVYFRRPHPIERYIADFLCFEHRLIIELDGGQHNERPDYDMRRDQWFADNRFRVLRFWNHQVMSDLESVLDTIHVALVAPPPPAPSRRGRG